MRADRTEYLQEYYSRPEVKARCRDNCKKLAGTPKRKASAQRYNQSDKGKKAVKKYQGENREQVLLTRSRVKAREKGLDFDLELSDIVIPEFCPVLGIRLDPAAEARADNLPSLDRIDPNSGYIKGNVWVISWRANWLKAGNTLETFRSFVRAMEDLK